MPKAPLHDAKRRKNFTLLLILLAMVGALFYLTILKIKGA